MSSSSNPSIEVKFFVNDKYTWGMRVGLSDTIFDVKLKLNKAIFMSVCFQRLSYKGVVLEDNQTVQSYAIAPNSTIKLDSFDPYQGKKPDKVQVFLKLSIPYQPSLVSVTVNLSTDYVMDLKQKLLQVHPGLTIDRVELYRYGKLKLEDDTHISHYFLLDGFEIDVIIKPPQSPSSPSPSKNKPPLAPSSSLPSKNKPPLAPSSSSGSNKMMIKVLTWCKTKLHMEVNATDKVQVLKDELRKLQATARFELSADGYFFIHKQHVLEDHESFVNNGVCEGDELEIFNGTVIYRNKA